MSARSRDKGARREREIVALHQALGIHAEKVPLSGAALAEVLLEISSATGRPEIIAAVIAGYAALPVEFVKAIGADPFPPRLIAVEGGRQ